MKLEQRTTMLIVIFSHTYISAIFCFHTKTYCHKIRTHFVYQISIYSPSALTPSQPASQPHHRTNACHNILHSLAHVLAFIVFGKWHLLCVCVSVLMHSTSNAGDPPSHIVCYAVCDARAYRLPLDAIENVSLPMM